MEHVHNARKGKSKIQVTFLERAKVHKPRVLIHGKLIPQIVRAVNDVKVIQELKMITNTAVLIYAQKIFM